jgi:hypothetical protein
MRASVSTESVRNRHVPAVRRAPHPLGLSSAGATAVVQRLERTGFVEASVPGLWA